ncbi:UdgX family uracil-DNA binding protein [Promicromonospora thailandica]|uniref:Type-4 uracil-DNA glycosylase n=1 Tax=Promicromonospora thailandica TaxID=765201 RepID=A0A9X2G745_9MICO|nr:UdgX family uracil-DNA binding protein [Promicromonospora thailandica]MCP2266577.1 DNA polymerase [Promicromonospora thailandica]BFF17348.1 UdgX family uracil-DNA binding protein [Promicromonospora thailandica]
MPPTRTSRGGPARPAPERPGAQRWVPEHADVAALASAVHDCRGCELWRPATQAVFSAGPADATVMLVGEQPGDHEDQEGEPFVGPAGRVLDDALREAGLDGAYLTNAVKHFRFTERGKRRLHRTPDVAHVRACLPWLTAELAVVRPRVVVALGAIAGRAVLGRPVRIGAERGQVLDAADGAEHRVVLTTHPSAVLRLRGTPDYAEAFAALVADLRLAARTGR